jgi:RHS repeat-associated protein
MRIRVSRVFCLCVFLLAAALTGRAQVSTGGTPFSSTGGGPVDQIDLGNLNVHLGVPIFSKPGRGTAFQYNMSFDSSVWYPVGSSGSQSWQPVTNWGWRGQTEAAVGYVSYVTGTFHGTIIGPPLQHCTSTDHTNFVYHDIFGVPHPFSYIITGTCGDIEDSPTGWTKDGTGLYYDATAGNVTTRLGRLINPGVATYTDTNGNQITSNGTSYTDTLGTTVLSFSGSAPNPVNYTYTSPAGTQVSVQFKFTSYTVLTHFNCSGVSEYGPTSVPLVSSIVLPDGTSYSVTYEATPGTPSDVTGRIQSITLPTGGTITYTYTGGSNGIVCADGSTAGLTRQTPDGTWTYARSGSGSAWTTTVTDPSSSANQSVINFQVEPTTQNFYETERQVYQGAAGGTLLKTIFTCYNTATPNCNSTAVALPITKRSVYVQWPGTNGLESRTNTLYNSVYGMVTESDEYGYGAGAPGSLVRKTLTTYASLTNGIQGRPATITVQDGSGNTKSQTTYTYDQGSVSGTSGTPQHVAISGSRGNATTISYLVQGTTSLTKTFVYFDTGTVKTATDFNGATTTNTYGTSSCGNSFPTSVSEPLSLSRSMAWNCTGGVQTSVTDENGKTSTTTYNDQYFWRPYSVTDPASNTASFTYAGATSAEGSLSFGSSTLDLLTTRDSVGRSHISQKKQGPSSGTYDSVETDYDSLGRPSRTTLPYPATGGSTNSSAPGTNSTYDALSRKILVADSGGGTRTVAYTYSQNDTYRTLGPAPTGENTKRKQSEYDSLGRMTSVCEVTNATGSGSCAQTSAVTGYWTQYAYDALNDLTGVTQNAQSSGSKQTRTYAYDDLGRMTSETNPEAGTTNYTFDSDTTCGTSKGDLVKKVDAVGNTTCFAYDALHRVTSTTYSGPYSASTPSRFFVYDAATVNSVAMANAKTRMAEAYTCVSPCSTKITDLGFSYTVLGQPTDVYESTPHSGGYYHVTGTYYANGALNQLSNLVGLPTITYGVDGEGRVNSASASSGQNPLTSTAYNTASLPTQVNLGSSDSDSYTYDPNSNRMTKYTFAVNGQSVVGSLTWNAIATLQTLGVTDPFYGAGNQTCSYTHDDMSRIASANCGSPWAQTFSYDAFGNLSKSGTISFQPTYSYLTNRMTQVGSSTPTYDANGNVLTDTAHTYTWDVNGRPLSVDGVGLTYDALGRMVEQNRSSVYSQIVYAPSGGKLALMSGTTFTKAFVPLSGGSVAVYNSSGLAYYRHSDWLGSSRFASTPARALYFDGAYAPFGENYAQTGTTDVSFTGMNQDTVSNLFDFPAREYNGIHGRWPSPDPAGVSSVHLQDPQSFNRYAYVRNSPVGFVDPNGMDDCSAEDGSCDGKGGADGANDGFGMGGGAGDGAGNEGGDPSAGDPGNNDPCTGNPGLCDAGDPCSNPFAGACSDPFGGNGPVGWGNGNVGGPSGVGGSGDPCAYLNKSGTGVEYVDNNSSPGECGSTGGVWYPDGGGLSVSSDGMSISIFSPDVSGWGASVPCIGGATCQLMGLEIGLGNWAQCVSSNIGGNVATGVGWGVAGGIVKGALTGGAVTPGTVAWGAAWGAFGASVRTLGGCAQQSF